MPVSSDTKEGENSDNFIHVQNLPWSACRSDIRQFFNGLSVKKGGILVRQRDAFVAFEDPLDIVIALGKQERILLGVEIQLSVINKTDLQKTLLLIARRKLEFGQSAGDSSKFQSQPSKVRKIRPTPVLKYDRRRSKSCSAFLPEESDLPSPSYLPAIAVNGFACGYRNTKRFVYGKRKVHPTSLSDETDIEKFSVFHPQHCYDPKKMKLDV